mgnify:FL=1
MGIRDREPVRSGFWEVMCYAAEPSGPDYYLFKTYQNGVLLSDSLINWISYDDRLIDGNYILGLGTGFISKRRGETLNPGDTVTLEISGIEKWFHEYVNFMRRELFPQTPLFSATPTNVKGNISGGALGYFTARSVTYISTVYKGTGTDN